MHGSHLLQIFGYINEKGVQRITRLVQSGSVLRVLSQPNAETDTPPAS